MILVSKPKMGNHSGDLRSDFYSSLYGPGGLRVLAVFKDGLKNPPTHQFFETDDELLDAAQTYDGLGKNVYHACAAYHQPINRKGGNVQAVKALWLDLDVGEGKPYTTQKEAAQHFEDFRTALGLPKSHMVSSGNGVHAYLPFTQPIPPEKWDRIAGLFAQCLDHFGVKHDPSRTTDKASILRIPGTHNHKANPPKPVVIKRLGVEAPVADLWAKLKAYADTNDITVSSKPAKGKITETNDIIGNRLNLTPYSYKLAAEQCGAMREAAQLNGRDTQYPVWFLAVKTADLSTEGRAFAHKISSGHADYEESATDKKIESLTGGPASCATWAGAYGSGGPCDTCEHKGTIKNPAVQLGALVDTTAPGTVPEDQPEPAPPWVAELNERYALVRTGSKMTVADFQTYGTAGRGVGWLVIAAFRQMFKGRLAPIDNPGDKARPLADAWLSHLQRLQYEGLVFAPGESLPTNVLNLWQGFAFEPVEGDVSLWLEVLAALVTDESDRLYVLRWLAWKVQNPGGVPDTILIFKGAKGTGKNSLLDPLIALFGRHAMLADDPELIAGRFTWHLMSLAFAVLDEAVFAGNPQHADRVKSRVTAKTMMYEQKGMDPVQGVNRCAYVMLTNHDYVWQATTDERRAVVIEVGESLRGDLEFWTRYHAGVNGDGPAALLHYLQRVDLTGFNPREIPKGEALRKQVEQTALRIPAAAWWHQCLNEGAVRLRDGYAIHLDDTKPNPIPREILRQSYEQSAAARQRHGSDWCAVAKKLNDWAGLAGVQKVRASPTANGAPRGWVDVFPPLPDLKAAFTAATKIGVTP